MKGLASYLPTVAAGVIAVTVGFASSVAVIFQAAQAAGATVAQTSSWILALCLGAGVASIGFSLRYRKPVLAAWSTPGAAVLGTSLAGVPLAQAVGAFVVCGALIAAAGATGWFERAAGRIPLALAAGMLAGVLLHFGVDVFAAAKTQPALVFAMLAAHVVGRRVWPRFTVIGVLAAGIAVCALLPGAGGPMTWSLARLQFVRPEFSPPVLVGVALPLFLVTMASQNLPGIAAQRAFGYEVKVSPVLTGMGLLTVVLAPFGAFAINLAAITAAICMGPEAHKDPAKRYVAAVTAGVAYLLVGLLAATVGALLARAPREFILALAGIALLGTITANLSAALKEERTRDAGLMTFLVSASGVSAWGISAPFWGLVAGIIALLAAKARLPRTDKP